MKYENYKLFPNLYIHYLREKNCIGIFHSLTLKTTYIPLETHPLLDSLQHPQILEEIKAKFSYLKNIDTVLDLFIREKILINKDYCYTDEISSVKKKVILQKARLRIMYVIVSELCNFRCLYCHFMKENPYSYKNSYKRINMPAKIAVESALFFSRNAHRENKGYPPVIIFYGGEPLFNFDIIKLIVSIIRKYEFIKDLKIKTKFVLVTNGTMVTKDIAQFLVKFNFDVGISMDGFEDVHNRQRIQKDTKLGSFKETLRGYNILVKEGCNPAISCTIGRHNVNSLPEIAKYFVLELKVRKVEFSILYGSFNKENISVDMDMVSTNFIKAFEILRNSGAYENRIGRHLDSGGNLKIHPYDCAAYGNQLVILPDGDFGPCHAFSEDRKYFFGNILKQKSDIFLHPILKLWRKRSPLNMKRCLSCPAIYICGGGCAFEAEATTGSLFGRDERCCKFYNKYFLRWYIEDRYNKLYGNAGKK